MAVKLLAGERLVGTAAERAALSTVTAPAQTSWKVVARGRVTGGTSSNVDGVDTGTGNSSSNNNVITVNTLYSNPPDNIMFLMHFEKPDTNSRDLSLNLGKDTIEFDHVFQRKRNISNTSGWSSVEDTNRFTLANAHNELLEHSFNLGFISNIASQPKNITGFRGATANDGWANGLNSAEIGTAVMMGGSWKGGDGSGSQWTNKLNRLTFHRKQIGGSSHYYLGEDSEFVILGCDNNESDNETRGDTFWNLIGETELDSAGELTATFAAKRWLMFEIYGASDSSDSKGFIFNDTTSSQYGHRTLKGREGYSDGSYKRTGQACIYANGISNNTDNVWWNGYIDNASNGASKLICCELMVVDGSNTGSTEPNHTYTDGKWSNSAQVTSITATDHEGNKIDYKSGSWIRVWGSD